MPLRMATCNDKIKETKCRKETELPKLGLYFEHPRVCRGFPNLVLVRDNGHLVKASLIGLHANSDARNRGGEASLLPLLAQHLAAPSLLSASAKLRAAASQARVLHSTHGSAASAAAAAAAAAAATVASLENPLIAQALLVQPATPPDMGPASVGTASESASPSKGLTQPGIFFSSIPSANGSSTAKFAEWRALFAFISFIELIFFSKFPMNSKTWSIIRRIIQVIVVHERG